MDIDEVVRERRSCKEYHEKDVPYSLIAEILEAGTYAPSAGNRQNWIFIVVKDEKKRYDLSVASLNQNWMNHAPVHIVICDDKQKVLELYPDRGELYSIQNCTLAAANMMLKAHALGLGTCWVGAFDVDHVKRILNISGAIIPEMILTLGYPLHLDKQIERDPVDIVTHFEEYGKREAPKESSVFPLKKENQKKKAKS